MTARRRRLGIVLVGIVAMVGGCSSVDGDSAESATSAAPATDTDTAGAIESAAPADPDLELGPYYRDVIGSPDDLATCLADAAAAESMFTVADLQAAEADLALTARLADAQDACLE